VDGVKLTEKSLMDVFAKHGIQKIQCSMHSGETAPYPVPIMRKVHEHAAHTYVKTPRAHVYRNMVGIKIKKPRRGKEWKIGKMFGTIDSMGPITW